MLGGEVGITSLFCYFPGGWAAENEETLWRWSESEAVVKATGRLVTPGDVIGIRPADQIRDGGLNDCILEEVEVK